MKKDILILGSGSSSHYIQNLYPDSPITTIDINPSTMTMNTKLHITHDLNYGIPLPDNSFDLVIAHHILEHLGSQGDYRSFFSIFSEIWSVLRPDGILDAIVPSQKSIWAWGDPGHTRIISRASLIFLSQSQYTQIGRTAMTDYRSTYSADFAILDKYCIDDGESFSFKLKAIKDKG
jgi:SAM-dependent methyltransferase